MSIFDRIRQALAPFDNGPHCDMHQAPLFQLYPSDAVEIECTVAALRARVAQLEGALRGLIGYGCPFECIGDECVRGNDGCPMARARQALGGSDGR